MASRVRVVQGVYLAALAAVGSWASPRVAAAQQIVPCNVCVQTCSEAQDACRNICTAGTTLYWQCWGDQSCTGQHGGTFAATVRCTVDVP